MKPTFRFRFTLLIGVSAFAAAFVFASCACAFVLDIPSSFPDAQGGNGLYAQAYNPATSTFRLLDDLGELKFGTAAEPVPYFPKAYVKTPYTKVSMHPTTSGTVSGNGKIEWVVVSWLVPQSGFYTISGSFFNDQPTTGPGCTTIGRVFVNDNATSPLFSGDVNATTTAIFNLPNLHLFKDNYVHFAVDAGTIDSYDLTALTGTIYAPEPASLAALMTGLVGFAALRRRKR
jgi:hypothetical protein